MSFQKNVILVLPTTILVIFLLASNINLVSSQFRFCYNGPQIVSVTDCPGGFISKKPISIRCLAYKKESSVISINYQPDECVPDESAIDPEEEVDQTTNKSLHSFWREYDSSDVSLGETNPTNACLDDCLPDWVDPDPPEEPFVYTDPYPVTMNEQKDIIDVQTKHIFTALLEDDDDDNHEAMNPLSPHFNDPSMLRVIQLLAKSMRISVKACDGFVESNFFAQVLKGMTWLTKTSNNSVVDIGIPEYRQIDLALDRCLQAKIATKNFTLSGTKCDNMAKVEEVVYAGRGITWKYRALEKSFHWGKFDPIVEAAWDAVDIVHGLCFSNFIPNLNFHHLYEVALEGLFPTFPVQMRWFHPTELPKGVGFWNNVLQTTDIKQTMSNLDACAIGSYEEAPYTNRLDRPFATQPVGEPIPPKPIEGMKGYKEGIEEYLKFYQKRGGFKTVAAEIGTCLENRPTTDENTELQLLRDDYKAKTCPDL